MKNNLKQKMLNAIAAHPRLVTLGITLAITTTITLVAAIGVMAFTHDNSAFAFQWFGCNP
jgi:hypothetical protein